MHLHQKNTVLKILSSCLIFLSFGFNSAIAQNDDSDIFFREGVVHTIEIDFLYNSWFDTLMVNHRDEEYVSCTVTFEDEEFRNVGIRFKGNSSFQMHPGIKKPIKLKFNRYDDELRFFDMKTLNFGNSFLDPTMMREKVFLEFCAAQRIVCARSTFANVIVNGELLGFYSVVEQINKDFIERNWGANEDGNLYKGDPRGDMVWRGQEEDSYYRDYTLETNEDENDWSDLINMIDVLNNTRSEEFVQCLEEVFDVADYLLYEAAGGLFVNLDAYRGSGHNYYVYHVEADDRFRHIVWDCNEAFGVFTPNMNPDQIIGLDIGWSQPPANSRPLMTRILSDPIYRTIYLNRVIEMVYGPFQRDSLFTRILEVAEMIRPHVRNDRNKMFSNQDFERGLREDIQSQHPRRNIIGLERFIRDRRQAVLNQIDEIDFNPPLRINEILAENHSIISDEADEYEDGIELINMTDEAINLEGIGLTDRLNGEIWVFPDIELEAGGYIWIWCDGDEDQENLHASFRLNADGEQVLLFAPDGRELWDYISWRNMGTDLSWGRYPDGEPNQRLMSPTPGEENIAHLPPQFTETRHIPVHPSPRDTVWVITGMQLDNELESIVLFHRTEEDEEWENTEMHDDGRHNDEEAGDGWYGASLNPSPVGVLIEYYLTAEDDQGLERFDPARAPDEVYSYVTAENWDGLVMNELQASNDSTVTDPQGDFDDWIELYNDSEVRIDISGFYLTDDLDQPNKWSFPQGSIIEARGFLLIWADEDINDEPGLHSNFRLSGEGEQLGFYVSDGDEYIVIDTLTYGAQQTDRSYGRLPNGGDDWVEFAQPTPGELNTLHIVTDRGLKTKPADFDLAEPYPNPFNSSTTIRFNLVEAGKTSLKLFDISGRLVEVILQDHLNAGRHQISLNASHLAPGLYFIQLEQGEQTLIRKALLLK
ncbi:MAG: CotH kinase family protein [Candidatus Hatepunaea meridiana]|nr:CotH kinase family protein [Candidatus Hatepunaea meridiana]